MPQLAVLALKGLQLRRHIRRHAGPLAGIDLGLLQPLIQPIFAAIDTIACQREGYSASWSSTIRTARARTSGENLFVVLLVMAPSSQELRPPAKPGRFSPASVSRWHKLSCETGAPRTSADGGDNHSHRVEAHRELMPPLEEETPDLTIEDLRGLLSAQGISIGYDRFRRSVARSAPVGASWGLRRSGPRGRQPVPKHPAQGL